MFTVNFVAAYLSVVLFHGANRMTHITNMLFVLAFAHAQIEDLIVPERYHPIDFSSLPVGPNFDLVDGLFVITTYTVTSVDLFRFTVYGLSR